MLADPTAPIYIVESEKTACLLSRYGIPAVAIGGVNSYTAHKAGFHTLTPGLLRIVAPGRPIVVAYDSDKVDKPQVFAAEQGLLSAIDKLGAVALSVDIPPPAGGGKNGPDTSIVECGIETFRGLPKNRPGNLVEVYTLASMYGYVAGRISTFDSRTGCC